MKYFGLYKFTVKKALFKIPCFVLSQCLLLLELITNPVVYTIFINNILIERQHPRASYIYEQSNDVLENWLKLVISYGGGGEVVWSQRGGCT